MILYDDVCFLRRFIHHGTLTFLGGNAFVRASFAASLVVEYLLKLQTRSDIEQRFSSILFADQTTVPSHTTDIISCFLSMRTVYFTLYHVKYFIKVQHPNISK